MMMLTVWMSGMTVKFQGEKNDDVDRPDEESEEKSDDSEEEEEYDKIWEKRRIPITKRMTGKRKKVSVWTTLMMMLTVWMTWIPVKFNREPVLVDKEEAYNEEVDSEVEEGVDGEDTDRDVEVEEMQEADKEDVDGDDYDSETNSEDDMEMERWRKYKEWGWRQTTPPPPQPPKTLGGRRLRQRRI